MNPESTPSVTHGEHSQFALLLDRRFGPLFATQFLGAFNDNVYKNALIMLLTFHATSWSTLEPTLLSNLAMGLFILPFFLFSATAGQLADKFDKSWLARWVKLLEIVIILLAALGFALQSLTLLLAALFLLGAQSTFFGPVKYAILPQHLRAHELIGGNALVEAGTFIAILLGTLAGGILAGLENGAAWISGISLLVAVLGYLSSLGIPAAAPPMPALAMTINPCKETWRCIGFARENRSVFLAILAISWFWLYGALLLTQLPEYVHAVLKGGKSMVTVLLAVFSVGIGMGSLLCEKLTRRKGKTIELGLVPLGALGITLFGLDLAFVTPAQSTGDLLPLAHLLEDKAIWRVLVDLFMMGAFGGLYCVPLYAVMQQRSPENCRARVIAANNIFNALFMVAGVLFAALLFYLGTQMQHLFLLSALMNGVVTLYICRVIPEFHHRALAWLGIGKKE